MTADFEMIANMKQCRCHFNPERATPHDPGCPAGRMPKREDIPVNTTTPPPFAKTAVYGDPTQGYAPVDGTGVVYRLAPLGHWETAGRNDLPQNGKVAGFLLPGGLFETIDGTVKKRNPVTSIWEKQVEQKKSPSGTLTISDGTAVEDRGTHVKIWSTPELGHFFSPLPYATVYTISVPIGWVFRAHHNHGIALFPTNISNGPASASMAQLYAARSLHGFRLIETKLPIDKPIPSPHKSPALTKKTAGYPEQWNGRVPARVRLLSDISPVECRSETGCWFRAGEIVRARVDSDGKVFAVLDIGLIPLGPGDYEVTEWHLVPKGFPEQSVYSALPAKVLMLKSVERSLDGSRALSWAHHGDILPVETLDSGKIRIRGGFILEDGEYEVVEWHKMPPPPSGTIMVHVGRKLFEFASETEWVYKAKSWYANCGVRSSHWISITADGRIAVSGKEFMEATKRHAYPISVYSID